MIYEIQFFFELINVFKFYKDMGFYKYIGKRELKILFCIIKFLMLMILYWVQNNDMFILGILQYFVNKLLKDLFFLDNLSLSYFDLDMFIDMG